MESGEKTTGSPGAGGQNRDMALVNIERLRKLPDGQGVEILSYKRNRGISLFREGPDSFTLRERGYRNRDMTVRFSDIPRILKSMISTEFPRSRKVRVGRLGGPEEADREVKRL